MVSNVSSCVCPENSVDGKLLKQERWTLPWNTIKQVDLQNLPSGIYFYNVYDKNSNFQGKIVKQ